MAEHLSSHNLLIEESFPLLNTAGEPLLLGLLDSNADELALLLGRSLGLLFCDAGLLALVPPQVSAELGLVSTLVVKVDGITYSEGICVSQNVCVTFPPSGFRKLDRLLHCITAIPVVVDRDERRILTDNGGGGGSDRRRYQG